MVVLTADSSEGWVETGESLQFIGQVPGPRERPRLKTQGGDGDMAQQVKAHAIKPDYLTPRGRKSQVVYPLAFTFLLWQLGMHVCIHK